MIRCIDYDHVGIDSSSNGLLVRRQSNNLIKLHCRIEDNFDGICAAKEAQCSCCVLYLVCISCLVCI